MASLGVTYFVFFNVSMNVVLPWFRSPRRNIVFAASL